jgi:phage portal protein BeeE
MKLKWPWAPRPGMDAVRVEIKQATGFVALHMQGEASWMRRDYATLAREGFMKNPVVHRSVRLKVAIGTTIVTAVSRAAPTRRTLRARR